MFTFLFFKWVPAEPSLKDWVTVTVQQSTSDQRSQGIPENLSEEGDTHRLGTGRRKKRIGLAYFVIHLP